MGSFFSKGIPAATWTLDMVPDLAGKVVRVSGGNTGIGKETCRAFLVKNAKVYMAARDETKAQVAIEDLAARTGRWVIFLQLDLAKLVTVNTAVAEFRNQKTSLHILFNNAGIMIPPHGQLTSEGYDLQFGTHVLGHHYLTQLLPPCLQVAEPSPSRIIFVSNSTQGKWTEPTINYSLLRPGEARDMTTSWQLYAHSKFAVVVLANECARQYGDSGIVSLSVDPEGIRSDLQRHLQSNSPFDGSMQTQQTLLLYPTSYGPLTQLFAGYAPEAADMNGKVHGYRLTRDSVQYLVPWTRIGEPLSATGSHENGEELWSWLQEQFWDM